MGETLKLVIEGRTELLPLSERECAMERYWRARQGGDLTASLTRADGPAPDPEPPSGAPAVAGNTALAAVPEPAPEAKPREATPADPEPEAVPEPTKPGEVSEQARERVFSQERILSEQGFLLPPPLFAPGTRVLPIGDQNFRLERERVEALPVFASATSALAARVAREQRRDVAVPAKNLAMTAGGNLMVEGEEHLFEEIAFLQLATLSGFGSGARYLAELCSPLLRSLNVNAQIERAGNREVTLRTRDGRDGKRSVFAVVSPSYAAVDGHDVLTRLQGELADTHVEVVYDGRALAAVALWMPDEVVDLSAGDIFKVGVRIQTDDCGRGRLRVSSVVFRNLCLNLLVIGEASVEAGALVHRGDRRRIETEFADAVARARGSVGPFLEAWRYARSLRIDVVQTVRGWLDDKQLVVPGERDREQVFAEILRAWQQEPGTTLADAVNAVSRAAHATPRWNYAVRESLERQAAELVLAAR